MSVSVCMCVDVFVHSCMWTAVGKVFCETLYKLLSTIGRRLSTILVTVLCLFAAPAFGVRPSEKVLSFSVQVCFVAQKLACRTLRECMLFSLKFHPTVGGASFWSSCESLLGTNLPQVLPPYDINLCISHTPPLIKAKSEMIKDEITSSICDLTHMI